MGASEIEWTDATWNPVRGCTKISPGCKHCYAETFAERWRGVPGHAYEQGFDLRLVPHKLAEPLGIKKPTTFFVNSMSDLFHEGIPSEYVAACFGVMAACHWHRFQVLTKRPERMARWFQWVISQPVFGVPSTEERARVECSMAALDHEREHHPNGDGGPLHTKLCASPDGPWPLPNVDIGVSVEDRKYGVPRIAKLRDVPAARRFLSIEPLLEDLGKIDLRGIDQVIVGAESGHGARPMNEDWVRSVRDQTKEAGAAFFYKQRLDERGRKVSLPMLDGRQWSEMPEVERG